MLLQDVGERFVGQFLNGRHPVAPELLQFVERVVVEGDQLAHHGACFLRRSIRRFNRDGLKLFRRGTGSTRCR